MKEEISLSEINTKTIFKDLDCEGEFEWHPNREKVFQLFIDILKNDYNQKYTKITLCEFSHSGETVVFNSLAIFHDVKGDMTILSFGMDWHTIRKKIKIPSITTEDILSKLSSDGNFTEIIMLDVTKNTAKCYFRRNFNYEAYKGLQDLSFFNSL